ncbi:MAG: TonB-dependent receptor [Aquabacterium sp.]|uniref:TonB-dependent siderophore receptor n=1 Tax=Aquabacterium sp. TaxID=1872578 RepID=UPI00120A6CB7|nr:TonB-dependent receptor [Aquabacterium sp.]TAK92552.1 MAG: TonB-dependent receptor [Aquabacterium sp.]
MPAMRPANATCSLQPEHALPVVIVLELFEMHRQKSVARATKALNPLSPLALAVMGLLAQDIALAQSSDADDRTLPSVNVTAPAKRQARASIAGLGDGPAWQQPVQAQSFSEDALKDAQATRLADLTKLDASTTDSYNTIGYWDYLTVRGFTLDNAYNYRREGLPINAETRLPMDNKAAVELLKGTSGMQAGISAPGGLVNLVVKRPDRRVRTANVALTDAGDLLTSVDLGDRFGEQAEWGLRVNAAAEKLATHVDNTRGHRQLLALAADRQLAPGHKVEAEYEHSYMSQPSVPGFSLLGDQLPSAHDIDPNINLNNQPWSQPVQMQGDTGTVRLRSDLGQGWKSSITLGEQRLKSNDRAAFPLSGDSYSCTYGAKGLAVYCANGNFDLYDFRSDNELRLTRSLLAEVQGQVKTGPIKHDVTAGVLRSLFRTGLSTQAYNQVPEPSNLADPYVPVTPAPTPTFVVSNRKEQSTEWRLQDALSLGADTQAWLGVRYTQLHRESSPTGGTEAPASDDRALSTPWMALAYTFAPQTRAYVSWGEGIELKAAPYGFGYTNPGAILPTMKSRQWELGVKGQTNQDKASQQWGLNWFHIKRPEADIINSTYVLDGLSTHQGIEGYWQGRTGSWLLGGSGMLLDAKRHGSAQVFLDDRNPVNVPEHTLKVSVAYALSMPLPVTLQADVIHEGRRWVDPENTIRLPAWTRVDIGLRATQAMNSQTITWRLGVTNLFDTRAWRESPNPFGAIYLFPMPARTFTASAQIDF